MRKAKSDAATSEKQEEEQTDEEEEGKMLDLMREIIGTTRLIVLESHV